MITEEEMKDRCAIGFWLLANMLASAMIYAIISGAPSTGPLVALATVSNLFSYLVLIGALRHPGVAGQYAQKLAAEAKLKSAQRRYAVARAAANARTERRAIAPAYSVAVGLAGPSERPRTNGTRASATAL